MCNSDRKMYLIVRDKKLSVMIKIISRQFNHTIKLYSEIEGRMSNIVSPILFSMVSGEVNNLRPVLKMT
jgi:hypothetical protein